MVEEENIEGTEAEGYEEVEEYEDDIGEEVEEDEPTSETPQETVERVIKEREAEEGTGDGDQEDHQTEEAQAELIERPEKKDAKPQADYAEEVPARFDAEQKQAFVKSPKKVQQGILKLVKDHERYLTEVTQKANRAVKESQHITEAVRPYLLSHPELMEQGYTESRLVSALVSAHMKLTNPETGLSTWLGLGKELGVTDEDIENIQEKYGNASQTNGINANPEFQTLQNTVNDLKSKHDNYENQQLNQVVHAVQSEMETVRNERDASGNFIYPELHDSNFLRQLKPLVSGAVQAVPGLSYGDALKRAYQVATGKASQGTLQSPNPTRFPADNNQRANAAAVSVRGRSAPAGGTRVEVPAEALGADPRKTVEHIINQNRRR